MSSMLSREMTALVEGIDDTGGAASTVDLWRAGRARRRWAAVRSAVAAAFVLALLAFVVWPGLGAPTAPASPTQPSSSRIYPSVIPNPHLAPSALDAHRPMVATFVDDQSLYAVDDRGQVWKAPGAPGWRQGAAVSPNGRYATDGWALYDFVRGTSAPLRGSVRLTPHDIRTGAAWSPDSNHFAVVATESDSTLTIGAANGAMQDPPTIPSASGVPALLLVSWLDERTVLVVTPASPTPQDQTRGAQLLAFSWTVGSDSWHPRGTLQLPPSSTLGDVQANIIGTSPDEQSVLLPVDLNAGRRSGVALVSWRLPREPQQTAQPTTVQGAGRDNIDGITWRGRDLVVVRAGISSVANTGQVLTSAASGASRPTSWRAGAFDGRPYYNTWAVWRDRLFVWTVVVSSLVLIGIGIRIARPLAHRAGVLGDHYTSPFPIEARWIFSMYGGAR